MGFRPESLSPVDMRLTPADEIRCLVLSPGENGAFIIPVKSHGVSASGPGKGAYKSVTKWRTDAPERRRLPRSPPPWG
jgi:hypothetical protein